MRYFFTKVHPPSPLDTPTDTSFQGMEEDPLLHNHPRSFRHHPPRTTIITYTKAYGMRKLSRIVLIKLLLNLIVGFCAPKIQIRRLHVHILESIAIQLTYRMFHDLHITICQTMLFDEVHLNVLRKRLHFLAQNNMDISLQISCIMLNQICPKVSVRVFRCGNHCNLIGTNL